MNVPEEGFTGPRKVRVCTRVTPGPDGDIAVDVTFEDDTQDYVWLSAKDLPRTKEDVEFRTGWLWADDDVKLLFDLLFEYGLVATGLAPPDPADYPAPDHYFSKVRDDAIATDPDGQPVPVRDSTGLQKEKDGQPQWKHAVQTTKTPMLEVLVPDVEWNTRYQVGFDRKLWRYVNGVYLPDGEELVKERTTKLLTISKYNHGAVVNVVNFLRDRTNHESLPETPDSAWLNFANGEVNWATVETRSHHPNYRSTIQLPMMYRPGATCPAIEQFLAELWPADCIESGYVWEWWGYHMLPANMLKTATLLQGGTDTGKSAVLSLLVRSLGRRNVTAMPLDYIEENRFATALMFGKLANVCGELNAAQLQHSAIFKSITGGDEIAAEHKGKDGFTYHPFTKLVFSANEPPRPSDLSAAWFRRWEVVPFERVLEKEEQDINILRKLTTAGELSGLAVRAMEGLRRLMARGRFDEPLSIRRAGAAYRFESDSVLQFAVDRLDFTNPGAKVLRTNVYSAFKMWCDGTGHDPKTSTWFYRRMQENFRTRETGSGGETRFEGVQLNELKASFAPTAV